MLDSACNCKVLVITTEGLTVEVTYAVDPEDSVKTDCLGEEVTFKSVVWKKDRLCDVCVRSDAIEEDVLLYTYLDVDFVDVVVSGVTLVDVTSIEHKGGSVLM